MKSFQPINMLTREKIYFHKILVDYKVTHNFGYSEEGNVDTFKASWMRKTSMLKHTGWVTKNLFQLGKQTGVTKFSSNLHDLTLTTPKLQPPDKQTEFPRSFYIAFSSNPLPPVSVHPPNDCSSSRISKYLQG